MILVILLASGVLALIVTIVAVVGRRRIPVDRRAGDELDPLLATGISLSGMGVVLALTLGPLMYGMMAIGLVLIGVGANRMRQKRNPSE